jgi:hypothetical protein
MKKISTLLSLALLILGFTTYTVQAQFNKKGSVELGGSISYSSTTIVTDGTTADKSTSIFTFNPIASYFVVDGFSIGVSPGINIAKIAGVDNSITNLMLFAVPGYTFGKDKLFPFIEGWLGYTAVTSKANPISGSGEIDMSGFSFGSRGGVKVLVGKSGLFNVSVSYMMLTLNSKGADKRSGLNNLAIAMGFSLFINR